MQLVEQKILFEMNSLKFYCIVHWPFAASLGKRLLNNVEKLMFNKGNNLLVIMDVNRFDILTNDLHNDTFLFMLFILSLTFQSL